MNKKKAELSIEEISSLTYFDTREVAVYARKSPGAVRNLVLRRGIPYHKPGGRLLFVRAEIDEWIKGS